MPLFRYFVCVGAALMAVLFAVGDSDGSSTKRTAESWTFTDSLRSMAHHGEPQHPSHFQTARYRDVR
jgi:hypothetical protein